MSVPGTSVVVGPYRGDGITTVLNYPNYFIDPRDLVVWQADTETPPAMTQLMYERDYMVAGVADPVLFTYPSGAAVTLATPPVAGAQTWIGRLTPQTQPAKFPTLGIFPAATLEVALDRIVLMVQEGSNSIVGNVVGVAFGPPAQSGELNQILLNGVAIPGGNIGWICTTPGAVGIAVWNPYGTISLLHS
jgi:hypothetical protein